MDEMSQEGLKIASQGSGGVFMGLSMWGMIVGLAFSLIGFFYFKAGKRDADFFTLGAGIALMVFPYFVTNTLYMVLAGAGIMAFHYYHEHY